MLDKEEDLEQEVALVVEELGEDDQSLCILVLTLYIKRHILIAGVV